MTKEEYQEFSLRYKGCGACFPLYDKLNRFEKMWFTAIQKDVANLEKENRILEETLNCSKETCDNCGNIHCENFQRQRKSEPCPMHISYKARIKNLEHENDVLTESYNNSEMNLQNCSRELADAKELLKWALHSDPEHDEDFDQKWEEAEQFLKENKYE
jgi:hypothetical protein